MDFKKFLTQQRWKMTQETPQLPYQTSLSKNSSIYKSPLYISKTCTVFQKRISRVKKSKQQQEKIERRIRVFIWKTRSVTKGEIFCYFFLNKKEKYIYFLFKNTFSIRIWLFINWMGWGWTCENKGGRGCENGSKNKKIHTCMLAVIITEKGKNIKGLKIEEKLFRVSNFFCFFACVHNNFYLLLLYSLRQPKRANWWFSKEEEGFIFWY